MREPLIASHVGDQEAKEVDGDWKREDDAVASGKRLK